MTNPLGNYAQLTYDANNNKISERDRRENNTLFEYDVKNLLVKVTDPLGFFATTAYDGLDRKISETDKRGNTTTYTYDPTGT